MSGVYWGLAGTLGTQGQKGYRGHQGALGAPRGVGCQGAILKASGM